MIFILSFFMAFAHATDTSIDRNIYNILKSGSTDAVSLKAPSGLTPWSFVFPGDAGTSGYVLQTDGAGNTSWVAQTGGGGGLTFPIVVPNTSTPNIKSDSDTGLAFPSDGLIDFYNNNVNTLHLEPGQIISSVPIVATDFVYPVKSANLFLAGPVTGSPAIPVFRAIASGDISNAALPFPMSAPQDGAPQYKFDSDTGVGSDGDGVLKLTANNVDTVVVTANNVDVTGDVAISGNISAANYPPTGAALTVAGYDGAGALSSVAGSSWTPLGTTRAGAGMDLATDAINSFNFESSYEASADANGGVSTLVIDSHLDRDNAGKHLTSEFSALNVSQRLEGSAQLDNMTGQFLGFQVGTGNGATVGSGRALNVYSSIDPASTVFDFDGVNNSLNAQGAVLEDAILYRSNAQGTIGRNLELMSLFTDATVAGNTTFINANSNASITGNFNGMIVSQSGVVSNFADGYFLNQSGEVKKGFGGFDANVTAILGTDGGYGHNIFNANIHDGTITGSLTGFNFGNNSPMLDGSNITGMSINNQASGYRFNGVSIDNGTAGAMSEESRMISMNDQSTTARTKTGMDLNMSGAVTDDANGMRINMSTTSANADISGLSVNVESATALSPNRGVFNIQANGGRTQINSSMPQPADNSSFVIGNYQSMNTTINTPMSGNEFIQQLFQSNIELKAPVNPGPFGLGLTGTGVLNQIAIDPGVTQDFYRGVLLGATNPQGSGDLTHYVAAEILGLPSFGGSAAVTNKIGLRDFNGLGQTFCNGVTECWVYQATDPSARNWFEGSVVVGGGTGVPETGRKLNVTGNVVFNDSHLKSSQTTAPTTTPNANAGTGASCTVFGTDSYGLVELQSGTGAWASGVQCTVDFNNAFSNDPHCTFSPGNAEAALASNSVFVTSSTGAMILNFANADTAATDYKWEYHCAETN